MNENILKINKYGSQKDYILWYISDVKSILTYILCKARTVSERLTVYSNMIGFYAVHLWCFRQDASEDVGSKDVWDYSLLTVKLIHNTGKSVIKKQQKKKQSIF